MSLNWDIILAFYKNRFLVLYWDIIFSIYLYYKWLQVFSYFSFIFNNCFVICFFMILFWRLAFHYYRNIILATNHNRILSFVCFTIYFYFLAHYIFNWNLIFINILIFVFFLFISLFCIILFLFQLF